MIVYKFDVLNELKEAGYSSYRLRDEKLLSESTIQKLRKGDMVAISNLDTICRLLRCQPGEVIGFLWNEYDAFLPDKPFDKGSTDWTERLKR